MEFSKITYRLEELKAWLAANAPYVATVNTHLIDGSPERAYWAYGYYQALQDVVALFNKKTGEGN